MLDHLTRKQREEALRLAVDLYGHNSYTPMPEQVIRTAEAFVEWLGAEAGDDAAPVPFAGSTSDPREA